MTYIVRIAPSALEYLQTLDPSTRKTIGNKIDDLRTDAEKRGKPLRSVLSAYRSVHGAGRYRIIFEVRQQEVVVYVVHIGLRKDGDQDDAYALLKKYLKLGLIDTPEA
jgi:mRNA interferase RelE/StbE